MGNQNSTEGGLERSLDSDERLRTQVQQRGQPREITNTATRFGQAQLPFDRQDVNHFPSLDEALRYNPNDNLPTTDLPIETLANLYPCNIPEAGGITQLPDAYGSAAQAAVDEYFSRLGELPPTAVPTNLPDPPSFSLPDFTLDTELEGPPIRPPPVWPMASEPSATSLSSTYLPTSDLNARPSSAWSHTAADTTAPRTSPPFSIKSARATSGTPVASAAMDAPSLVTDRQRVLRMANLAALRMDSFESELSSEELMEAGNGRAAGPGWGTRPPEPFMKPSPPTVAAAVAASAPSAESAAPRASAVATARVAHLSSALGLVPLVTAPAVAPTQPRRTASGATMISREVWSALGDTGGRQGVVALGPQPPFPGTGGGWVTVCGGAASGSGGGKEAPSSGGLSRGTPEGRFWDGTADGTGRAGSGATAAGGSSLGAGGGLVSSILASSGGALDGSEAPNRWTLGITAMAGLETAALSAGVSEVGEGDGSLATSGSYVGSGRRGHGVIGLDSDGPDIAADGACIPAVATATNAAATFGYAHGIGAPMVLRYAPSSELNGGGPPGGGKLLGGTNTYTADKVLGTTESVLVYDGDSAKDVQVAAATATAGKENSAAVCRKDSETDVGRSSQGTATTTSAAAPTHAPGQTWSLAASGSADLSRLAWLSPPSPSGGKGNGRAGGGDEPSRVHSGPLGIAVPGGEHPTEERAAWRKLQPPPPSQQQQRPTWRELLDLPPPPPPLLEGRVVSLASCGDEDTHNGDGDEWERGVSPHKAPSVVLAVGAMGIAPGEGICGPVRLQQLPTPFLDLQLQQQQQPPDSDGSSVTESARGNYGGLFATSHAEAEAAADVSLLRQSARPSPHSTLLPRAGMEDRSQVEEELAPPPPPSLHRAAMPTWLPPNGSFRSAEDSRRSGGSGGGSCLITDHSARFSTPGVPPPPPPFSFASSPPPSPHPPLPPPLRLPTLLQSTAETATTPPHDPSHAAAPLTLPEPADLLHGFLYCCSSREDSIVSGSSQRSTVSDVCVGSGSAWPPPIPGSGSAWPLPTMPPPPPRLDLPLPPPTLCWSDWPSLDFALEATRPRAPLRSASFAFPSAVGGSVSLPVVNQPPRSAAPTPEGELHTMHDGGNSAYLGGSGFNAGVGSAGWCGGGEPLGGWAAATGPSWTLPTSHMQSEISWSSSSGGAGGRQGDTGGRGQRGAAPEDAKLGSGTATAAAEAVTLDLKVGDPLQRQGPQVADVDLEGSCKLQSLARSGGGEGAPLQAVPAQVHVHVNLDASSLREMFQQCLQAAVPAVCAAAAAAAVLGQGVMQAASASAGGMATAAAADTARDALELNLNSKFAGGFGRHAATQTDSPPPAHPPQGALAPAASPPLLLQAHTSTVRLGYGQQQRPVGWPRFTSRLFDDVTGDETRTRGCSPERSELLRRTAMATPAMGNISMAAEAAIAGEGITDAASCRLRMRIPPIRRCGEVPSISMWSSVSSPEKLSADAEAATAQWAPHGSGVMPPPLRGSVSMSSLPNPPIVPLRANVGAAATMASSAAEKEYPSALTLGEVAAAVIMESRMPVFHSRVAESLFEECRREIHKRAAAEPLGGPGAVDCHGWDKGAAPATSASGVRHPAGGGGRSLSFLEGVHPAYRAELQDIKRRRLSPMRPVGEYKTSLNGMPAAAGPVASVGVGCLAIAHDCGPFARAVPHASVARADIADFLSCNPMLLRYAPPSMVGMEMLTAGVAAPPPLPDRLGLQTSMPTQPYTSSQEAMPSSGLHDHVPGMLSFADGVVLDVSGMTGSGVTGCKDADVEVTHAGLLASQAREVLFSDLGTGLRTMAYGVDEFTTAQVGRGVCADVHRAAEQIGSPNRPHQGQSEMLMRFLNGS